MRWQQEGWHSGCSPLHTGASLALIPASFHLGDLPTAAAETQVAAQMPTKLGRYGECGPDGRQQGVVESGVN